MFTSSIGCRNPIGAPKAEQADKAKESAGPYSSGGHEAAKQRKVAYVVSQFCKGFCQSVTYGLGCEVTNALQVGSCQYRSTNAGGNTAYPLLETVLRKG